ncbi:T9SS type A sorting domain-containing protein [Flavobacterium sp. NST-5]|uniref:T9SS type A sorting domain-containing protein n=1 Tax=Flavobacterium ichthyis TaxID=2698827 RepID=A0ABW9Z8N2_9FLAO|nr:LamG-like jellyroll fold domain-containing protein [Flavobacterium ichthyis]NBL64460.1 T9SS type A sorting domain-containing protein [Flavobacterium ichthyis]
MKKNSLLNCRLWLALMLVCTSFESFSQTVLLTDNIPGNKLFVVPPGTSVITIEGIGGGGRGGTRTTSGGGGGGGGGAYSRVTIAVTPGQVIPYTVGAGSNSTTDGGDTSFLNTTTLLAKGGESVGNNFSTGGIGGQANQGVGDVRFSGGNGFSTSGGNGGGGGSSAGNAENGNNATNSSGATAPFFGGNGGNGRTSSDGSGFNAANPGGGGGGSRRTSGTRYGGTGGNGLIRIVAAPAYRSEFISMDLGIPSWCAGETRTVSVTVKNIGTNTWTNTSPDINIGIKWNGDPDYLVRTDANNLAPLATQTYFLSVTAPTAGTNNLQFDIVSEGNCWFANNAGTCGPENTVFRSSILNITNCPSNGPGGVRHNLQLWLRADLLDGTTGTPNNTLVSSWITQGLGSNAVVNTSTQEPVYRNSVASNVNFNAVVDFTNDNNNAPEDYNYARLGQQYLQGTSGYYTQDMFVVSIPDQNISAATASMDIFCGDNSPTVDNDRDGSGIGYGTYSVRFDNEVIAYAVGTTSSSSSAPVNSRGYGIAQTSTTSNYQAGAVGLINTRTNTLGNNQELYYNANNIGNTVVGLPQYSNISNSRFWIGRSQAYRSSLDARVAEIITFDARKNDATERIRIESYLGIKYGITLGVNGTSQNYVDSDNSVIWNIAANDGYNFNIAGIGRDDISRLTQKQSRSSNDVNDVVIALGDVVATTNTANTNNFANNKNFLLWGHNNGTLASSGVNSNVSLGTISTTFTRGNRIYKIVETGGDIPQTTISLPTNILATAFPKSPNQDYVLIVSTSASFASTNIVDIIPLKDNGTTLETWYDFDGTKFFSFGVATENVGSYRLDHDTTDFIIGEKNINLNANFTVSGWCRTSGNNGSIIAKNGAYDFYINAAGQFVGNWNNVDRVISTVSVNDGKWHYVAVTFSAGTARLFIDGVENVLATALPNPSANSNHFTIGAVWSNKNVISKTFIGDIDEIRIWNSALSETQLRYIMNQEIEKNGTAVFGKSIPNTITKNDISSTLWNNLLIYYDMNSFYGTAVKDKSNNNFWARLKYLNNDKIVANLQTAPLPYQTVSNGNWSSTATWLNGNVQELPYGLSISNPTIPIDWNIVETNHTITSNGNKNLLALSINSDTFLATNDSKVEISHYLKINGKLDLVGKSQLIQTLNSDFDATSAGNAERDQQGTSNLYNYNYWSSPVSTINATSNNGTYTVSSVFKDGTTLTPQNINFIGGYNGSGTSPISIARYWLYKFQNTIGVYANWAAINENSPLFAGQGFTMKGSGAVTPTQNYTFVGKPNNGRISVNISANMSNLLGNPYLSALDATQFITDNLGVMTGTIYFWDQYGGNSHILREYQGGYAARNLTGGVVAVANPGVMPGSGTKIPQRFIPVGQGFWIEANGTGGNLIFNNNQRAFIKEDEPNSFTMFRQNNPLTEAEHFSNNQNDSVAEADEFKKIRLNYLANGAKRDILLGFMNENATENYDPGYDGIQWDTQNNDIFFPHEAGNLVIQGVGAFDIYKRFPITLKTSQAGEVKINLTESNNFNPSQEIYVYDAQTETFYDIRNEDFFITLNSGTHENRFSIRFTNEENLTTGFTNHNNIRISYAYNTDVLHIKNLNQEAIIYSVTAFNILGQEIKSNDVRNENQAEITIPFNGYAAGTYIFKINTDIGDFSYKIIKK